MADAPMDFFLRLMETGRRTRFIGFEDGGLCRAGEDADCALDPAPARVVARLEEAGPTSAATRYGSPENDGIEAIDVDAAGN